MSPNPTLYYMLESPPCRTVLATARLLGIELDLKTLDLSKKEQFNPDYLKVSLESLIFKSQIDSLDQSIPYCTNSGGL